MADVNVVTEAVIPLPIADAAGYVADLANANGGSNITTLEWETAPPVGVGMGTTNHPADGFSQHFAPGVCRRISLRRRNGDPVRSRKPVRKGRSSDSC